MSVVYSTDFANLKLLQDLLKIKSLIRLGLFWRFVFARWRFHVLVFSFLHVSTCEAVKHERLELFRASSITEVSSFI